MSNYKNIVYKIIQIPWILFLIPVSLYTEGYKETWKGLKEFFTQEWF